MMIDSKFSVEACSNNPYRWYVSFDLITPFSLPTIEKMLLKQQFQLLASTPSIKVFRSNEIRLTWHKQGLIQIDLYNSKVRSAKDIEQLIKEILDANIE